MGIVRCLCREILEILLHGEHREDTELHKDLLFGDKLTLKIKESFIKRTEINVIKLLHTLILCATPCLLCVLRAIT